MTIIVHHLNNSRSQRILWLLEEVGEAYEVRRYERDRKTMRAPAALRAVHPLGRSPVVEVDGHRLIETGAIMEYLVARAGGRFGAPADAEGAIRWRQFLHYAEGSMMPPLLALLVVGKLGLLGRPARPTVDGTEDAGRSSRLAGKRTGKPPLFCRAGLLRRRHDDELPDRGVAGTRRA